MELHPHQARRGHVGYEAGVNGASGAKAGTPGIFYNALQGQSAEAKVLTGGELRYYSE